MKAFDEYARRARSRDGLQSYCRSCQHTTYATYYREHVESFRAKLCFRAHAQRNVNRRFIATFLADHPCIDCGVTDPIVLEFDHVRGVKIGSVGVMAQSPVTLEKLKREIEKCEVRCANCHRRRTSAGWRYTLRTRMKETDSRESEEPRLIAW